MGACQPGRMRPGELVKGHLPCGVATELAAAGLADMHFAIRQAGEHGESRIEGLAVGQNNRLRICRQRVGINSGHENRRRYAPRHRRFTKRTSAECRPLAGSQQLLLHSFPRQSSQVARCIAGEGDGLIAVDIDNNGLQNPTFAAMDGANHPSRRCGKADTGVLFVFEEDLPFLYPVTFAHRH